MRPLAFTKMVGTGNDFLVVDVRRRRPGGLATRWPAASRALCHRQRGVGADGMLVLEPSTRADLRMRIFNADGTEAEMCGNGARCVALYASNGHRRLTIETRGGLVSAEVRGGRVAMRMPEPTELEQGTRLTVGGRSYRMDRINTGVPHVIVPVSSLEGVDVDRLGRAIRRHPRFAPRGTNVNFIQRDPHHPDALRIRTYERGVEGETLACGTGATAAAIIHALQAGGTASRRTIHVSTRSGETLAVSMRIHRGGGQPRATEVMLEGPARRVFEGRVAWPLSRAPTALGIPRLP